MKEKKRTKKSALEKKKGHKKDELVINEPVQKITAAETEKEEADALYKQVSEINKQLIEEGNKILLERLPEKIEQLSEFIKSQTIFYDSIEDIKNKICLSVDEYKEECEKISKEVSKYRKEVNKSFNKWRKSEMAICDNLKKKPAQTQIALDNLGGAFNEKFIFPINKTLQELHDYLYKELQESIHILSPLSLLIELKIPRLEDGNNFGVQVQKEILQIITESSGQMDYIIDYLTKYYVLRGAVITHCVSKPYLQDIFQTLIEIDTSQFYSVKLFIKSIRDIYATIYDMMMKNYDKIQNPRNSMASSSSFF